MSTPRPLEIDKLMGRRYLDAGYGLCTFAAVDGKGKVRLRYDDGSARWVYQTSQFRAWIRSGQLTEVA